MELDGAKVLVAGAGGVLGGLVADALHDKGTRVVAGGRGGGHRGEVAERCGTEPVTYDVVDVDSCTAAVDVLGPMALVRAWLQVLRCEERTRLTVLDVRPPHLDNGLETRALAGEPHGLPAPMPASQVVPLVVEALERGAGEIVFDRSEGGLVIR